MRANLSGNGNTGPGRALARRPLRGGAAHVRMWTAVAGACESLGARAEIVDYVPAYMAATGLGFATWAIPGQ